MPNSNDPIVVWHEHAVSRADRERLNGHRGCVVWFTGLSGCGKSTVANVVDRQLHERGVRSYVLDGDNVRHGLNATPQMLAEQVRRGVRPRGSAWASASRTARKTSAASAPWPQLMCDAGLVTLTAFVSPYRADRDAVRASLRAGRLSSRCSSMPRWRYAKPATPRGSTRRPAPGELKDFTGIDAPYEAALKRRAGAEIGRSDRPTRSPTKCCGFFTSRASSPAA